jgi:ABC-type dipeptide/oligopeptide/nickel transport system permease component
LRYVVRRLALAILTILTIVVLNFGLVHPRRGRSRRARRRGARRHNTRRLRHTLWADQPLYVQLLAYLKRVTLDLGYRSATGERFQTHRQPAGTTLLLMLTVLVLSVGLGVLLSYRRSPS